MSSDSTSLIVELLWRIKRRIETEPGAEINFVHFNLLLRDPAYRRDVLQKAKASGDRVLIALVTDAEAQETGQPLVHGGDVMGRERPADAGGPRRRPMRRNLYWALPALLVALALVGFAGGIAQRRVVISESITSDTVWTSDHDYVLRGLIYVENAARLSIEPGTVIRGEHGSALIVTRDARIFARGQAARPIVFTSEQLAGKRASGDWGGLVLLGRAPVNRADARIEGVQEDDQRGTFGGHTADDSCGVLEYVRIEFAGYEVYANNELNGLTLGGCGRNTIVRNVQVHRALDDGIEVFGGQVDLKNILITGAGDDSLDWDLGWQGRVQFLIAQQYPGIGDSGFEGDSNKADHDAEPRSLTEFYNITLIGTGVLGKSNRAITLRSGSGGLFNNVIVDNFGSEALDTQDQVQPLVTSGRLDLRHALIAQTGPKLQGYGEEAGDEDDDDGFSERDFTRDARRHNDILTKSVLTTAGVTQSPAYKPVLGLDHIQAGPVPKGEFWDDSATYPGAINPSGSADWVTGWTDYPLN